MTANLHKLTYSEFINIGDNAIKSSTVTQVSKILRSNNFGGSSVRGYFYTSSDAEEYIENNRVRGCRWIIEEIPAIAMHFEEISIIVSNELSSISNIFKSRVNSNKVSKLFTYKRDNNKCITFFKANTKYVTMSVYPLYKHHSNLESEGWDNLYRPLNWDIVERCKADKLKEVLSVYSKLCLKLHNYGAYKSMINANKIIKNLKIAKII